MANTSFLLKGWSITIIAGLFAFSETENQLPLLQLAMILTAVFWFLDAYFLWQERLFRALYDHVRTLSDAAVDFSMDTRAFRPEPPWFRTPFSLTLFPFYGFVLAILTVYIMRRT